MTEEVGEGDDSSDPARGIEHDQAADPGLAHQRRGLLDWPVRPDAVDGRGHDGRDPGARGGASLGGHAQRDVTIGEHAHRFQVLATDRQPSEIDGVHQLGGLEHGLIGQNPLDLIAHHLTALHG